MPSHDSVSRQPVIGATTRRLPGIGSASPVAAVNVADETRQQLLFLREQFSTELKSLQEEARQLGLLAAQKEAESALQVAKNDLAREWELKEESLRRAGEQEQQALQALVQSLKTQHEQLLPDMEPVLARLALLVTAKLIGQHQTSRVLVADLARQAIDAYRLSIPLQVFVSAADFNRIREQEQAGELVQYLQVDPQAESGSCLIDYGSGRLEASLDTQWQALKDAVLQVPSGAHRADGL